MKALEKASLWTWRWDCFAKDKFVKINNVSQVVFFFKPLDKFWFKNRVNCIVFRLFPTVCRLLPPLAVRPRPQVGVLATASGVGGAGGVIGAPPEQRAGHRGSHFVRWQIKARTGSVTAERRVSLGRRPLHLHVSASHIVSHISAPASNSTSK